MDFEKHGSSHDDMGSVMEFYSSGAAENSIMYGISQHVDVELNVFSIPHSVWNRWKEGNVQLFLDCLDKFINDNQLSLPYPLRDEEAYNDFCKLSRMQSAKLIVVAPWSHTFDYKYSFSNTMIDNALTGNVASSDYNLPYRCQTRGGRKKSAVEIWNDKLLRRLALNSLKYEENTMLNNRLLNNIMRNKGCGASQFRPSVAKSIYEYFDAESVYDFSSGWGDRLVAALASPNVKKYYGTDPNSELQKLYQSLVKRYDPKGTKIVNISTLPAEEYIPDNDDGFDLVFTSCPYFDLEKYAFGDLEQEEKQSWKRYQNKQSWMNEFLYVAIENSWTVLKKGGHLVINMADFIRFGKRCEIADPMNDFISKLPGAKYKGCIGMRLNKRQNRTKSEKKTIFAEPLWVWKKL